MYFAMPSPTRPTCSLVAAPGERRPFAAGPLIQWISLECYDSPVKCYACAQDSPHKTKNKRGKAARCAPAAGGQAHPNGIPYTWKGRSPTLARPSRKVLYFSLPKIQPMCCYPPFTRQFVDLLRNVKKHSFQILLKGRVLYLPPLADKKASGCIYQVEGSIGVRYENARKDK